MTLYANAGWDMPMAITSGPDGNLWFTEYGKNKIGKITTDGVITEYFIPTADSTPQGTVGGPDNCIWFAEWAANKRGKLSLTDPPAPSVPALNLFGFLGVLGGLGAAGVYVARRR